MANKDKQVNVRITDEINKAIDLIKTEMEDINAIKFNRSQIIFMLIQKGIKSYQCEND